MNESFSLFTVLLPALWAFGAAAFYALMFNGGIGEFFLGGFVGAVGWGTYVFFSTHIGYDSLGYLTGAFFVATLAELLAFLVRNPATVYMIPGLIPLVPGAGMFQTMRSLVAGQMDSAGAIGYKTLMAAGAIALGIAVASSLARLISLILRRYGRYCQQKSLPHIK